MDEKGYLFEEYKILEERYRTDTNRIWSQAQILIAANLIAVGALASLFVTGANKESLVDPRFAISTVSVIGAAVSLAWFLSVVADGGYQELSWQLLREMERDLDLPEKVFTKVTEKSRNKWWAKVGGAKALTLLSFVFTLAWVAIGWGIWKVAQR